MESLETQHYYYVQQLALDIWSNTFFHILNTAAGDTTLALREADKAYTGFLQATGMLSETERMGVKKELDQRYYDEPQHKFRFF